MAENSLHKEVFNSLIHNPDKGGWHFGAGEPEFWKYGQHLIVPEGRVLDLGIGEGRTSLFFALNGMEVTGLDISRKCVTLVNKLATFHNLPIQAAVKDIKKTELGENIYDVVVLGQTLIHFQSKAAAFKLLDKAISATKKGGYIWVRALGKEDSLYSELTEESVYSPNIKKSRDVYLHECGCSGKWQYDPFLFFDQTELLKYFCHQNMNILHSQAAPQFGRQNIMYGEDWPADNCAWKTNGMITVLARKQ